MRLSERRHQLATGDWQKSRRKKAITGAAAGSSHQQHPKSGNIIFSVGKREGKRDKRDKERETEGGRDSGKHAANKAENIFNAPEVIIFSYFTPAAAAILHVHVAECP